MLIMVDEIRRGGGELVHGADLLMDPEDGTVRKVPKITNVRGI